MSAETPPNLFPFVFPEFNAELRALKLHEDYLGTVGFHCFGCYDPELCSGVDPKSRHCANCVLDDEFCPPAEVQLA